MSRLAALSLSLVLLLVAFPLISFGTTRARLSCGGWALALVVGGLIPPAARSLRQPSRRLPPPARAWPRTSGSPEQSRIR